MVDKAIEWLKSRDIDVKDNMVELANRLSFMEEVCKKEEEIDYPIPFDGQNCDNCRGWFPGEYRCECGNRRVAWVRDYDYSFLNPSIHAEAH